MAVIALLLVVAVCTVVSTCSARSNKENAETARTAYQQQSERVEGEINLPPSMDPQIEAQLESMAETDARVDWIIRHTTELGVDGPAVLMKLLKLTAKEPEAIDFVRGFPESYPQETGQAYTERVTVGTVPSLYQWDERWGYTVYSSTTFSLTGCCPTCLSMVYMGLTGKNDKSPYDMGRLAQDMGFMTTYEGTDSAFLTEAASSLGLSAKAIPNSADAIRSALQSGCVVIVNVTEGDFTTSSHFIVLADCGKNGETVVVHDPFSAVNSAEAWDLDTVVSQSIAAWSYAAA